MRLDALLRLAFAAAPSLDLTSPHINNSSAHSSKGRPSGSQVIPPTACKLMVSGTISLPSPGCFSPFPHGTSPLSVVRKCLALRGGPRRFTRDFTGPVLLGNTLWRLDRFQLRGCYLLWLRFPADSPTCKFCNSMTASMHRLKGPTTPIWQRHRPLTPYRFGLHPFRSPLLRASLLLSFPRGTEMFQFPRFPLPVLCVQTGVTGHNPSLVFQFGHPRVNACLTTHRGLSQPATSFIGSERQGIHHQLLVA